MSDRFDCPRLGKWFRSCRFEARYSDGRGAISKEAIAEAWPSDLANIYRATKPRTYVRDVCVTCGRTVEKQETGA